MVRTPARRGVNQGPAPAAFRAPAPGAKRSSGVCETRGADPSWRAAMDELPIKNRARGRVAARSATRAGRAGRPRRSEAAPSGHSAQAAAAPMPRRRPGRGGGPAPRPRRRPGRGGRQADHSSPTSDPLSAWRAGKVRAGRIGGLRAAQEDEASMTGDEWSAPRPDAGPGDPSGPARCGTWRRGTWRRGTGPTRDRRCGPGDEDLATRERPGPGAGRLPSSGAGRLLSSGAWV